MITPTTEEALSEAVKAATGPLAIQGGGTRPIGGAAAGDILSTTGLSGIQLYEPGALTLVARAGTPLAEIETALAKENQRLAFEPMDHRALLGTSGTPTLGGVVAANVSGPRRVSVGACRDFMLGVRFVDGAGTITKNGGRVMKDVTGYDLVKLFTGSYGTLGVLTEVSLKVLPDVAGAATLRLSGLDPEQAIAAMSSALGSPFEVTGAAWAPGEDVMIRLEGFENSVRYRAERLTDRLDGFGAVEVTTGKDETATAWASVRDVTRLADLPGDVWRVSTRPSMAADLLAKAGATDAQLDWGGGLLWLLVPEGTDLRGKLGAFDGHATLMRAGAETRAGLPTFQPEAPGIAALTAGLRAKFDPRGIFNPGLMAAA